MAGAIKTVCVRSRISILKAVRGVSLSPARRLISGLSPFVSSVAQHSFNFARGRESEYISDSAKKVNRFAAAKHHSQLKTMSGARIPLITHADSSSISVGWPAENDRVTLLGIYLFPASKGAEGIVVLRPENIRN